MFVLADLLLLLDQSDQLWPGRCEVARDDGFAELVARRWILKDLKEIVGECRPVGHLTGSGRWAELLKMRRPPPPWPALRGGAEAHRSSAARTDRPCSTGPAVLPEAATRKRRSAAGRRQPVREQAFRRVVLRACDYRCAACGLRVILDDMYLVEAAHLVPWTISRDDDPRNGIALCKNHHWDMDRYVIAPSPQPERTWKVSSVLDDRIEGQRDLLNLHGRSILLPREERFHPLDEGLAWRMGRLLRA